MITRREFLTRSVAAFAGTALLASAVATPALADHKNGGVALARTREMLRDGSCDGSAEGHPHNHGEESMRMEGMPRNDGMQATTSARGMPFGPHTEDCPHATGECDGDCPQGNGECDGTGPEN